MIWIGITAIIVSGIMLLAILGQRDAESKRSYPNCVCGHARSFHRQGQQCYHRVDMKSDIVNYDGCQHYEPGPELKLMEK